ncbi:molybdenum cofactor guanylyltransferase [Alicyclobacillus acidoterrestris]|uniref:NTP transferase domain-containing protein n=1 Tax=Alicyclobacillus acidoterrestris (strain ATCC 49025 / DSM 3922 / CIP 106132 / NCIMB 13137 / GD3B) TaxID=1356854 RepID=A0A9E6ZIK4_ALIAG|nr:NTP transferase domain-containing protein [Alicyclobacillus acidoterrestris]UNO49708.1 NTP transferase domain-containing protein [Alicyclobacillus acidoterrestris]
MGPDVCVVVAGGQSRRMQPLGDKLLLPRAPLSPPILAHVLTVAASLCDCVIVAHAPGPVRDVVARHLPVSCANKIDWQLDAVPWSGPLTALAHVFTSARVQEANTVGVVAGDLPGITADVLQRCHAALAASEAADGAALVRDGRIQPLIACYRHRAVAAVVDAVAAGQVRLMGVLDRLNVIPVALEDGTPEWRIRPVHTPEDYEAWLAWRAAFETS